MRLAWELSKTEKEILDMPPEEFGRWVAFFQILDEEEQRKQRRQGQAGGLGGHKSRRH